MKHMNFSEAVAYINKIGILEELPRYSISDGVALKLLNDETLVSFSNYEGDYSEVTPGAGIQPPSFILFTKNEKIYNPN